MPPDQASAEPSGWETIEALFAALESPLLSYALRLIGERGVSLAVRDRPHVGDPEIVSGQADRGRLSHRAASLVPETFEQPELEHA